MKVKRLAELESFQASKLNQQIEETYRYLPQSLSYNQEYFGNGYQDLSGAVLDGEECIIAYYAFCKDGFFGFFNEPVKFYHLESSKKNIQGYQILASNLRNIFKENKFEKFEFYDNEFMLGEFYHQLTGSKIEYSSSIDLKRPYEEIKSSIRKSYKSLVNWGEKSLVIKIVDSDAKREDFMAYQAFHVEVSGRQTRSQLSWDLQYDLLRNNKAYLVLGYFEEKLVAGSLVLHGHKCATYGVGVYDRGLMQQKKPLAHATLMRAMQYAQSIGLEKFEMGVVNLDDKDPKKNNIAQFKKGFSDSVSATLQHRIVLK